MANLTFTSPALNRDLTVYGVAGARKTLLALAIENGVPIHCECQNGECGSCAVLVEHLGMAPPKAVHLTEKEKVVLRLAGKLDQATLEGIEVTDLAPDWRLACQYMLLDEDIIVRF